jgi:hypothetical protein
MINVYLFYRSAQLHHHHLQHHHHVAIKELGPLLTRSCLTHPEVSSVVFLGSFCLLGCGFYQSDTEHYFIFNQTLSTNFGPGSLEPYFRTVLADIFRHT